MNRSCTFYEEVYTDRAPSHATNDAAMLAEVYLDVDRVMNHANSGAHEDIRDHNHVHDWGNVESRNLAPVD